MVGIIGRQTPKPVQSKALGWTRGIPSNPKHGPPAGRRPARGPSVCTAPSSKTNIHGLGFRYHPFEEGLYAVMLA